MAEIKKDYEQVLELIHYAGYVSRSPEAAPLFDYLFRQPRQASGSQLDHMMGTFLRTYIDKGNFLSDVGKGFWEVVYSANLSDDIDYNALDYIFTEFVCGDRKRKPENAEKAPVFSIKNLFHNIRGENKESANPAAASEKPEFGSVWERMADSDRKAYRDFFRDAIVKIKSFIFTLQPRYIGCHDTLWAICVKALTYSGTSDPAPELCAGINRVHKIKMNWLTGRELEKYLAEIEEINVLGILDRDGFEVPAMMVSNLPALINATLKNKKEKADKLFDMQKQQ